MLSLVPTWMVALSMARLTTVKSRLAPAPVREMAPAAEQDATWGSGRGGRPWRRRRDAILLRDKYTCQSCGKVTADLEVDHIVNLAQGGSDDDINLQSLCIPCHKVKTALESTAGRS